MYLYFVTQKALHNQIKTEIVTSSLWFIDHLETFCHKIYMSNLSDRKASCYSTIKQSLKRVWRKYHSELSAIVDNIHMHLETVRKDKSLWDYKCAQ